jgi:hypothetical protein
MGRPMAALSPDHQQRKQKQPRFTTPIHAQTLLEILNGVVVKRWFKKKSLFLEEKVLPFF